MSWESISLSDALRPLKSSPFTRDELNYSGGQYQNVHYGDILVRFPSVVDAEKVGLPYVNDSSEGRCTRCTLLQNGDIIIADTAEDEAVGKAIEIQGIKDQKVVSGLHTMAFRPQEGLFAPGFLGYFLNSSVYHNQLLPLMQGIKVLSISKTSIGDTVIKYPSYKEQEKIVESLSGVDDMIRALDEAIAKKRQIKEGLMQQLLTGTTRLPGFSGEWKTVYLGDLGDFSQGNGFPVQYQGKKSGDYPFYKVSDFNNVGNELYMCMANNYINKDVASILSCKIIPHGSIFMAKIGAAIFLERKRLTTIPCCIDNNTMAFIPNEKLFDSLFALYLFQRIHVGDYAEATALPAINLSNLKKHEVYIPSTLNEHKAIAHVLQSGETDILALESLRGKYDSIKQGMIQELLTGKTRLL